MTEKFEKFTLFRIRRFKDQRAYKEIFMKHGPGIRKYLVVKLPTHADVDDIFSSVFERGWKYFTNNKVEYPNALFRTIAKSLIADFYKKRPQQIQLTEEMEYSLGDQGRSVQDTEVMSEMVFLKKAMKELRDDYQEILNMRFMDQMSISEIANVIGKTDNNTRVIIHRATKALGEIFNKEPK